MRDRGSRTAETSAVQRALHTLYDDDPKIMEDPYALGFSGPRWGTWVGRRGLAWFVRRIFAWLRPMIAHHLARSRYVEERLDDWLEGGLRQYVLLGAGMDSFALRRPDLSEVLQVFEIDHPGTQARKRARMQHLDWQEPPNVCFVPLDFENQTLEAALGDVEFDPTRPALFAWMGVTYYLTRESIVSTLRDIAKSAAPGSEVVFDCLDRDTFDRGRQSRIGRRMFDSAERWGEPLISGYDPPEMRELLAEVGFETLDVVMAEDFETRWFKDRPDGLIPWEHAYVVRAVVRSGD